MMLSVPELASQAVDETLSQAEDDNASTMFLMGSKGAGKSTLINSFLDKNDPPRETLVLEYLFGRKANHKQSIDKTICHMWEFGGKLDTLNSILPSIPIRGKFYYIIVVDLSKVKQIWYTVETCLLALNHNYSESNKQPELLLIGSKYDHFKTFDSEMRKLICTTIRSLALLYNANVLFYSSKDASLARKVREVLHTAGFGTSLMFKEKNTNFAKPLVIPKGSDSWEAIGTDKAFTLDQIKTKHLSRIAPEPLITDDSMSSSEQKTAHPELNIDKLAKLQFEELRHMDTFDVDDYLHI